MATPILLTPFPFHPELDAAALSAAGWTCTHMPEWWEDVGDAENGPKLDGCPAYDSWTSPECNGRCVELIVIDGEVVDAGYVPPEAYFADLPF